MRNALLAVLWNRGPAIAQHYQFVCSAIIKALVVISKLAWVQDERQHDIPNLINNFVESNPAHCAIGLELHTALVDEINTKYPSASVSLHRKVSSNEQHVPAPLPCLLACLLVRERDWCIDGSISRSIDGDDDIRTRVHTRS